MPVRDKSAGKTERLEHIGIRSRTIATWFVEHTLKIVGAIYYSCRNFPQIRCGRFHMPCLLWIPRCQELRYERLKACLPFVWCLSSSHGITDRPNPHPVGTFLLPNRLFPGIGYFARSPPPNALPAMMTSTIQLIHVVNAER